MQRFKGEDEKCGSPLAGWLNATLAWRSPEHSVIQMEADDILINIVPNCRS